MFVFNDIHINENLKGLTPKELFDWAVENGVENCEIRVHDRTEDGVLQRYRELGEEGISIVELYGENKKVINI